MSGHSGGVGLVAGNVPSTADEPSTPNTILRSLAEDLGLIAQEPVAAEEASGGLAGDTDLELYMNGTGADFLLDDAMCATSSNNNDNSNVTVVSNPEVAMLDKLMAETKDEDILRGSNDWEESFEDLFPDLA